MAHGVPGRNWYELIRTLDTLMYGDYYQASTPANWEQGDEVLVDSSVPEQQHPVLFPKGVTKIRPYYWSTHLGEEEGDV